MEDFNFKALTDLISAANKGSLVKKAFPKKFEGLDVKYGLGQGTPAKVPWIAFLGFGQKVQKGIYPVFLYYKDNKEIMTESSKRLLILAYGVSAGKKPDQQWLFPSEEQPLTINEYFSENFDKIPYKYGESFVFKVYTINLDKQDLGLNPKSIMNDAGEIVGYFKNHFDRKTNEPPNHPKRPPVSASSVIAQSEPTMIDSFVKDANESGFSISKDLATRFIASLIAKPFVILTGLSGSGKTKLGQTFASVKSSLT